MKKNLLKLYVNLNPKFSYLGENMDELIKKGAVELGQLIKKGETSSGSCKSSS